MLTVRGRREASDVALVAGTALVLLAAWTAIPLVTGGRQGDVALYETYGRNWLEGQTPYRDFAVEYPPLSLLVMVVPALLPGAYASWYAVQMGIFALATAAVTLRLADLVGADRTRTAVAFAAGLLALSVHPPRHLDLAPTCCLVASLLLVLRGRAGWAGAMVASGVLLKVFPLLVAPAALVWLAMAGGRHAVRRFAAGFAVVLALGAAAAAAASSDGAADMLRYHLDRPAQVDSSPAVLLRVAGSLGIGDPRAESEFVSDNVVGPGSRALIAVGTGLFAGSVVLFTARLLQVLRSRGRRTADPWWLIAACFAAVAALIVFGKVLSPQFMIWLVPLLALSAGRGAWGASALLLTAMLLTTLETGATYFQLVAGDPLGVAVAGLRIALIAGVLVLLWHDLADVNAGSARGRAGAVPAR